MTHMKHLKYLPLVALVAAMPSLGLAQEAEAVAEVVEEAVPAAVPTDVVWILNSLLFLIGGFLVFFMAAGFAMLEAGLVRSKNVTMQLMKNMALFSLAAIFYYLIGYNLMYPLGRLGDRGLLLGPVPGPRHARGRGRDRGCGGRHLLRRHGLGLLLPAHVLRRHRLDRVGRAGRADQALAVPDLHDHPDLDHLPAPGVLEVGRRLPRRDGLLDFAGSTVVHSVGGWAALAGAIILGPRIGKYAKDGRINPMPGSNLALATLGTFILWLGWFGFNGGSQLAMGSIGDVADVSRIFVNTNAAAAGGSIVALILTQVLYKKPDLTMVLNGALAGLVSITAEPLTPSIGMATLIGGSGASSSCSACRFSTSSRSTTWWAPSRCTCSAGIWGTIAVVLTNPDASFGTQIVSIVIVAVFTFVASLVVWLILKGIMGLRVDEEAELRGLDMTELGMEAYPDFTKG
jgi:ammonium transporter, Amt family